MICVRLKVLIHLGYLTYDFDTKTAWIPNTEVQQEFTPLQDNGFAYVMKSIQKTDLLLKYTLEQNAGMVAEILGEEHTENTSII